MTKLLLALTFTTIFLSSAHAHSASDYINSNMLWQDNEEFHEIKTSAANKFNGNWSSNTHRFDHETFHQENRAMADEILHKINASLFINSPLRSVQAKRNLINSNMMWSDDKEFQAH